jgi:hypothetical protein
MYDAVTVISSNPAGIHRAAIGFWTLVRMDCISKSEQWHIESPLLSGLPSPLVQVGLTPVGPVHDAKKFYSQLFEIVNVNSKPGRADAYKCP